MHRFVVHRPRHLSREIQKGASLIPCFASFARCLYSFVPTGREQRGGSSRLSAIWKSPPSVILSRTVWLIHCQPSRDLVYTCAAYRTIHSQFFFWCRGRVSSHFKRPIWPFGRFLVPPRQVENGWSCALPHGKIGLGGICSSHREFVSFLVKRNRALLFPRRKTISRGDSRADPLQNGLAQNWKDKCPVGLFFGKREGEGARTVLFIKALFYRKSICANRLICDRSLF